MPLPEAETEPPAEGPVPPLFEELLPGLSVAIDTTPTHNGTYQFASANPGDLRQGHAGCQTERPRSHPAISRGRKEYRPDPRSADPWVSGIISPRWALVRPSSAAAAGSTAQSRLLLPVKRWARKMSGRSSCLRPIRAVIRSATRSSSPAIWAIHMILSPSGRCTRRC